MALNLYRRHRQDCSGGHAEDSRSGEFEERSKRWKRCKCQIYAAGTIRGQFRRRRTGKWTWEEATAVSHAWEASGSWDVTSASAGAVLPRPESAITVAAA